MAGHVLGFQVIEVLATAKCATCTRNDDHSYIWVFVNTFERVDELRTEGVVERIQYIGAIDGDGRHVVGDGERDGVHVRSATCE